MKLTRHRLKEIIAEELKFEVLEKTTAADIKHPATVKAVTKAATASGVTDEERSVLSDLQKQLAQAAQVDNIATGQILALATKLSGLLTQTLTKKTLPGTTQE